MTVSAGPISIDNAVALYERLSTNQRIASLHPSYAMADARRDNSLHTTFWRYEEGGELLIHGFHLSEIPRTQWLDLQSPYGYGGPIATTHDSQFLKAADDAFLLWARSQMIVAEFLRFHPMLENWKYYLGEQIDDRETVWVDCSQPDIITTYEVRQRTSIRKAIKDGVTVRKMNRDELLQQFPDFYREAMQAIEADQFYLFPDEYFQTLFSMESVIGLVAVMDDEIVAMSLFLLGEIGEYHLSAKSAKGARHSATSLIMHEAFGILHQQGIAKAYLGGGTGTTADDRLLFFKKGFSKHRAQFKIGKRVILPAAYDELKILYAQRYQDKPQRILFYRS